MSVGNVTTGQLFGGQLSAQYVDVRQHLADIVRHADDLCPVDVRGGHLSNNVRRTTVCRGQLSGGHFLARDIN